MKHLIAVLFFGFVPPILGGEEAAFETAEELKIGESGAFELSKNNRAILKLGENGYFVFDLLDSSREDKGKTFTEACSISWTLITPSSIKSGAISAFIRYSSVEIQEDSFTITRIAGSDTVEIEGLSIRWSYASPEQIFLYPSPGTEYAISKVEQSGAKQASTVVELKSEKNAEPGESTVTIYKTYRQLKRLTKKARRVSPITLGDCRVLMPTFKVSNKESMLLLDPSIDTLIKLADKSIPEQGNPAVEPHTTVDPHFNTKTRIYVNTLAGDIIAKKIKSFPAGSVIVKEKLKLGVFDCTVSGIGGMIKRAPGYDAKHGDWEYFYGDETTPFISGRIKNCIECHTDARDTDYIFSVWKIAVNNDGNDNQYPVTEGDRNPRAPQYLREWHDTLEMGSSFRKVPVEEEKSVLSPDVAP